MNYLIKLISFIGVIIFSLSLFYDDIIISNFYDKSKHTKPLKLKNNDKPDMIFSDMKTFFLAYEESKEKWNKIAFNEGRGVDLNKHIIDYWDGKLIQVTDTVSSRKRSKGYLTIGFSKGRWWDEELLYFKPSMDKEVFQHHVGEVITLRGRSRTIGGMPLLHDCTFVY